MRRRDCEYLNEFSLTLSIDFFHLLRFNSSFVDLKFFRNSKVCIIESPAKRIVRLPPVKPGDSPW